MNKNQITGGKNEENKLLKVLCLSLGVASLMGITSIPIYAIPTGYTQEEWDAKQKADIVAQNNIVYKHK